MAFQPSQNVRKELILPTLIMFFGGYFHAPKIGGKSGKGKEKSLQATCDKLEKSWKSVTYRRNLFSIIFGFLLLCYQST